MSNNKFKILSIDGGGIRGVFPARFLSKLEADLKSPIAENFDLICGTSTGGILALALALKIPASDIEKLYVENRKLIFPPFYRRWRLGLNRAKYNNKKLEDLIRNKFKKANNDIEPLIADLYTRVCITGYDLINAKPKVFKTPHKDDYYTDLHIPAYQVAMATSAAPTYFNPYSSNYLIGDDNLKEEFLMRVDGGVFANNPALIGLTEAHCSLGIPYADIELYSIGTGQSTYNETRSKICYGLFNKPFGAKYWISKIRILDLMMQAQSRHVHDLCIIFSGGTGNIKSKVFEYYRIQQEFLGFKIAMDSNKKNKLEKLMFMASNKYQLHGQSILSSIKKYNRWNDYSSINRRYTFKNK
ncbi:CBASS cGAMP-activated phospholipase [Polaribacter dokdonensis]|uniref:Patatin n=1 Tax=Polaribacter dokdonensis DSW-5 TaxID=1300348 RepID=A0A0M9CGA1_9FLAO|nr:CBASS cGAMP-activated phospholipase [Polaribacter dokdonensis]KOY51942.1 Patatin [Polaribacter dokdonensis DSW-5]SED99371.1 Patatin-like phospholipase [Polaribacter dokdonensis DSW-5]